MVVLGMGFLGGEKSLDPSPTDVKNIKNIKLTNGIIDELFITQNVDYDYSTSIPQVWDFDTILHAHFNGNLHAGNVDYTTEQVSHIRIKIREKNTFDWLTVYEIPINKTEDFKIERFYGYCKSDTEYEVAIVPIINGVEGNLNINSVLSKFSGIAIVEKDRIFTAELDIHKGSVQRNKPNAVINTVGSKYPFVINNGDSNYDSGSITATFVPYKEEICDFEYSKGFKYRKDLMDQLCDGKPKVLKYDDGRMWLISVVDSPSEQEGSHPENISTTINWVESGDIDSQMDLYENDLIDVSPEWWRF